MLKVWNVSLVLATGILALLGTFLVRSGILDSIHAFGASTLGVPFLILIGLCVTGSVALVVSRRAELRSEHRLDSLFSRESVFLLNNLVLVGLCFVIFWGTFFPLISEAVTGTKSSLGPPWFDRYTVPLALVLVLLAGIGPLMAWRRVSLSGLRSFAIPVAVTAVIGGVLAALGVARHPAALIMFSAGAFVVVAVSQEVWRGVRVRRAMSGESPPAALASLVARNRRRYGGYTVHVGMAVLFVGVAASSAFQHARDVRLSPGQSARVGGYDVRYVRPTAELRDEKVSLGAVLDVRRGDKHVATLEPTRGYYPSAEASSTAGGPISNFFEGQATSEVGLRAGLRRDVWTAVQPDLDPLRGDIASADRTFIKVMSGPRAARLAPDVEGFLIAQIAERYRRRPPPATFRLITSPLVTWIWLGAIIVAGGALIALWPAPVAARRRARAAYAGRVARELGQA